MSVDPEMEMPPAEGGEEGEPMDAASVMAAAHEALEIAYGDEAVKAAMLIEREIVLTFDDEGGLTVKVGDASKTITADELDAALAGDEPVEVPDEE